MRAPDRDRQGRPWLYATASQPSTRAVAEIIDFASPVSELAAASWESSPDLFSEVARDFPLPAYFGHNWDALDECVFTKSRAGRLVVIRDVSGPGVPNLARFVDLFSFVWLPIDEAKKAYLSLFDGRCQPGRVAIVILGFEAESLVPEWPGARAREYRPSALVG